MDLHSSVVDRGKQARQIFQNFIRARRSFKGNEYAHPLSLASRQIPLLQELTLSLIHVLLIKYAISSIQVFAI